MSSGDWLRYSRQGCKLLLLWHQTRRVRRTTCKDNTEQRARRDNGGYRKPQQRQRARRCQLGAQRRRRSVGCGPSQFPSVLFVTAQRAGAAVSGLPHGRWGVVKLGFSCMGAARVPVAPAVGVVPLCLRLVPRWHRRRCDVPVVCWLDACTAGWLGYCRFWLV